ncbi:hypothetical protein ILYODFUR_021063 [Ilyodon furcidens]|uniref:Uncharacterized protein n=1 Tax=Ilyodon furcidens TaxID=33524 RepID=A0ABV0SN32_9TELE
MQYSSTVPDDDFGDVALINNATVPSQCHVFLLEFGSQRKLSCSAYCYFFSSASGLKAKNAFVAFCTFFVFFLCAELGIWGKSNSVVSLAAPLFFSRSPTEAPSCIVLWLSSLSCKEFSCLQSSSYAQPSLS